VAPVTAAPVTEALVTAALVAGQVAGLLTVNLEVAARLAAGGQATASTMTCRLAA
jgi:hypothetical protein